MRPFLIGLGNAAVAALDLALLAADAGYAPVFVAGAVLNGYFALACIAMTACEVVTKSAAADCRRL